MKKFAFKLNQLLKIRKNRRDLCRQLLAEVLQRDAELVRMRQEVSSERFNQLEELRRMGSGGRMNVDASVTRRSYAGQLVRDIGLIERNRSVVAQQIIACRHGLVLADQAVKALEKLEEKQRQEFIFEQERRTSLELEEVWRALHAGDAKTC